MALVESGALVPVLIAADIVVPPVLADRHTASTGRGGAPPEQQVT